MQASSSSIWYEACLLLVSRLYIRQLHCLHYYEFVGNKRQYFAIVMMISVHIAILTTSRWFFTRCDTSAWECHTSEDCSVLDKCADKECGCHSKNLLLKNSPFEGDPETNLYFLKATFASTSATVLVTALRLVTTVPPLTATLVLVNNLFVLLRETP